MFYSNVQYWLFFNCVLITFTCFIVILCVFHLVGVVGGGGDKLLKAILRIISVIISVRLTMELSK